MTNRIGFNRLSRKSSHRKALHRNMVTSLFLHERIKTTKAKALAVRRTAEKMITRAKEDSVANRRLVARDIKDKAVHAKLFTEISPRFKERPGGYTRVIKLVTHRPDAAEMVLLELVDYDIVAVREKADKKREEQKSRKKKPSLKSEKK